MRQRPAGSSSSTLVGSIVEYKLRCLAAETEAPRAAAAARVVACCRRAHGETLRSQSRIDATRANTCYTPAPPNWPTSARTYNNLRCCSVPPAANQHTSWRPSAQPRHPGGPSRAGYATRRRVPQYSQGSAAAEQRPAPPRDSLDADATAAASAPLTLLAAGCRSAQCSPCESGRHRACSSLSAPRSCARSCGRRRQSPEQSCAAGSAPSPRSRRALRCAWACPPYRTGSPGWRSAASRASRASCSPQAPR